MFVRINWSALLSRSWRDDTWGRALRGWAFILGGFAYCLVVLRFFHGQAITCGLLFFLANLLAVYMFRQVTGPFRISTGLLLIGLGTLVLVLPWLADNEARIQIGRTAMGVRCYWVMSGTLLGTPLVCAGVALLTRLASHGFYLAFASVAVFGLLDYTTFAFLGFLACAT